jgi:hypothetical protein
MTGARKPLEMGQDPDALLTIRHADRDFDSFEPRPIGELAQWAIKERDCGGLRRERWCP